MHLLGHLLLLVSVVCKAMVCDFQVSLVNIPIQVRVLHSLETAMVGMLDPAMV